LPGGSARDDNGVVGEYSLRGGSVNTVVRAGDTVRRRPGGPFVHELLDFFERSGWGGAPRFLGLDEQGREILSFVDGYVPWQEPGMPGVTAEASLVRVVELVREFHDLTVGTPLAGDAQVVCHNDLAPNNTVYSPGESGLCPVAFIDWDLAAPGRRIHDVAHVCWQYLGLGPGALVGPAARGIRLICDAYRLDGRDEIVDVIMWWQDRCWRGIEAGAVAGDPAMFRLRNDGAVLEVQAAFRWVAEHRAELEVL
jgi:Phosphotransferase enzyme family